MAIEVGKTRLEALGEVEEAADLIRYYAKTAEDNAFYDHPMDNLGDAAVHTRSILRPHGVFAVISPFNFPMALSVGPERGRDDGRQHGRVQAGVGAAMTAIAILEAYRDAGVPDGVFNLVMGPGDTVGDELQTNPGIDGIVFTGSYEVGLRAVPQLLDALPAAVHRGDGRQEPGDRARERGPRGGGRGHHARRASASAARSAPRTAASTWSGPSTTSSSACWSRRPRSSWSATRSTADRVHGPGHRRARGRPPPAGGRRGAPRRHGVHRRRAPDRRRHGARLLRGADGRRPAGLAPPVPGRAVRAVHRGRGGRLARRGAAARERQRLRPDRGRLLARIRPRCSGSSTRSRRASCTSTGAPAPRPAPGRASRRSAAGRAPGSTGKSGLSMYYVAQFLREQSHTIVD